MKFANQKNVEKTLNHYFSLIHSILISKHFEKISCNQNDSKQNYMLQSKRLQEKLVAIKNIASKISCNQND